MFSPVPAPAGQRPGGRKRESNERLQQGLRGEGTTVSVASCRGVSRLPVAAAAASCASFSGFCCWVGSFAVPVCLYTFRGSPSAPSVAFLDAFLLRPCDRQGCQVRGHCSGRRRASATNARNSRDTITRDTITRHSTDRLFCYRDSPPSAALVPA